MRRLTAALALITAAVAPAAPAQRHPVLDSAVTGFLRTPATPEVELIGAARTFDPGRAFAVAAVARRTTDAPVAVKACVVDSAATITVTCIPLALPRLDNNLFALDTIIERVQDDVDRDGRAELRFLLVYSTASRPATGPDVYERWMMFRAAPTLTKVLDFVATDRPGASGLPHRWGSVRMEDDDEDGELDVVNLQNICPTGDDSDDARCRNRRTVYRYSAARRTWVLAPAR